MTRTGKFEPATKLKAARLAAGLTQKELADLSGLDIRQIQVYEIGQANFDNARIDKILKIGRVLGADLSDLLTDPAYVEAWEAYKTR